MYRFVAAGLLCISAFMSPCAWAADFVPDPLAVQREGPAYRYPQAGWIVLHIEGDPYERGISMGSCCGMRSRITSSAMRAMQASKSPAEAWQLTRTLADALFVRRFDPELLEEMKGIADGAAAGGAKFDGRAVDLTDMVAINVWPELMTLDDALRRSRRGWKGRTLRSRRPAFAGFEHKKRSVQRVCRHRAGDQGRQGDHRTYHDVRAVSVQFLQRVDRREADQRASRRSSRVRRAACRAAWTGTCNDAGMVLTETTIEQTTYEPTGMSIGSRRGMPCSMATASIRSSNSWASRTMACTPTSGCWRT